MLFLEVINMIVINLKCHSKPVLFLFYTPPTYIHIWLNRTDDFDAGTSGSPHSTSLITKTAKQKKRTPIHQYKNKSKSPMQS